MAIHFLLTPDSSSALAVKREVAEQVPGLGVVVGTWPELLGLAVNSWLLPAIQNDWHQRLESAVMSAENRFWSASLLASPAETATITAIVGNALIMLLEGCTPDKTLPPVLQNQFPPRTAQYLSDLASLHQSMEYALPPQLAIIRNLLELPVDRMLRPVSVYRHPELPQLNPWQRALIDKLNRTAGNDHSENLARLLSPAPPQAPAATALGHLQRSLFELSGQKVTLDISIQWLAARDYLLEIEVVAGMIQQALTDDPTLRYADIGLLLPSDQTYHGAVAATFSRAGIPLSGLAAASSVRDLGCEAVSHLLTCLDGLAPVMALASLLVSPLMPWDKETANKLAQQAIGSDFRLKLPDDAPESCLGMLQLIRSPIVSAPQLRRCLKLFPTFLNQGDYMKEHREQARATCNQLITLMDLGGETISWQELKTAAVPQAIAQMLQPECSREGMAVFQEGCEPWRSVRRLYVLGCGDSHYPRKSTGFSLFTDTELEQIRSCWGCQLVTAAEQNSLLRRQFRRQFCSASEHVTFLLPRRDPAGKPLAPSASITFASTLFTGVTDAEELILELDSEAGRAVASGLPVLQEQKPEVPRSPEPRDLKFGMNLLELNKRADGSLKPESPSRLEKLMVSPLAWLFERLGVESLDWQPETLDIMSKGTLAHAVFEQLFTPGIPLPENDSIETQVPVLLEGIITQQMPFLNHGEWKVERKHLQQDIVKAALQWREILHQTSAKPVAVEIKLKGELEGIPIHGDADLLLELPSNRLYVVDYKKSTSGDRRKRMKAGYDHQAELYRTMIRTGGLKELEKAPEGLAAKLANIRDNGEIGTLYYLMNDQTALANTSGWLPGSIGNLEEMQTNSSINAMQLIKERFAQLRQGKIELNTPVDEREFKDKRGISAYALKGNSLVAMWMKD